MKRVLSPLAVLSAALLGAPLFATAQSNVNPPGQISYQGFLSDANGIPLATNTPQNYNLVFRLYNDPSASGATNILWAEQQVITVDRGYFTALLGVGTTVSGAPHTNNLSGYFNAPDASSRYVGMTVLGLTAGDPEITPRLQLLANPYSLLAATAINAVNATNALNAVNASNSINAVNATYATYATNFLGGGVWTASGTNVYFSTGNVGIGNNAPSAPLTFANAPLGDRIVMWQAGGGTNTSFGIGVAPGQLTLHSDNASSDVVFGYGTTLHLTETMRIKGNGCVGIGTSNPTHAALDIGGQLGSWTTGSANYWMVWNGIGSGGGFSYSPPACIYANGDIVSTSNFRAISDARLKIVQGRSDGRLDLDTLLQLKVTDYTYRDTLAKGTNVQKKLIAQEVEKVYPRAVFTMTDVVPDIYQKATIRDGWVQLSTDLKVGDRVRLHAEKSEGIYDVLEVGTGCFRTEFKPGNPDIFVYGREVKDCRSIDYEAIAMLNVSATQEVARQSQAKDARIADLTAQVKGLSAELQELKARDQAREARLARIESRLNEAARRTERASLDRE